jgi:hypothetical protein
MANTVTDDEDLRPRFRVSSSLTEPIEVGEIGYILPLSLPLQASIQHQQRL